MSELSLTQPEPQAPAVLAPAGPAPAVLVLADGIVLRGLAFGAMGTALGEVVFNTPVIRGSWSPSPIRSWATPA